MFSDSFVRSTDDVGVTSRSNLRKKSECVKCLVIMAQDRVQWRVSSVCGEPSISIVGKLFYSG